jgi:ribosomal protein S18 acetylase RimI-like enzyme
VPTQPFAVELLDRAIHKRSGFSCGVKPLDRYFEEQVGQDVRRGVTACFVLRERATNIIAGYYTLAAGSVLLSNIPDMLAKKRPSYPDVPVARPGRLAIDRRFQGHKLGGALLWDAIVRAKRSEVAVYALTVDAIDDTAVGYYRRHGLTMLSASTRQLVLPLANVTLSANQDQKRKRR